MVRRPALFLMDEPLSNLDAKLRGHMRTELGRMQHRLGVTTVYVTHDQVEAMTLADRVAILEAGVLQQLDTPKAIYDDPANLFVARFIGSPPMNLLEGRLENGRFHHRDGNLPIGVEVDVSRATLGVRPEDCTLVAAGEGEIEGTLYATELLGDHVLVTVAVGDTMLTVKAAKDFDGAIDAAVGVRLASAGLYLFDGDGARLRR